MISKVLYEGSLRTRAVHIASGSTIVTDAPTDNNGKGEAFSPTDLVCTSLASCMLTIMAIAANKHGVDIKGTKASVTKTMVSDPRRIGKIDVTLFFPKAYSKKMTTILERSALNCPVHRSLSNDVVKNVHFVYA